MTFPVWALVVVGALVILIPFASRYLRSHDHPEIADDLDQAERVIEVLAKAIARSDHTGAVANTVAELAVLHNVDDHPAVKRVTS